MSILRYTLAIILLTAYVASSHSMPRLKIASNNRNFITADGKPFFWLGDTGWLLFKKVNKKNSIKYLDTRRKQKFNIIQVMVLHDLDMHDQEGHSALINGDISMPHIVNGRQNDYWDHIEYVIEEAEKRGIYVAMVPIWGSNIKRVSMEQIKSYATFLAKRYRSHDNIVWMNGGDVRADEAIEKWEALGSTLRRYDPTHLITYHPRGRYTSSQWFHNASWLDFNMFQSGHRTYAQDTTTNDGYHYGEDNWRYVQKDYTLLPTKPTLDGEPSYEEIPYGLHQSNQPYWQDYEVRRYAYWSVLSGGAGFTYGHNSIMQFYITGDQDASYFPISTWEQALYAKGASQMKFLKKLLIQRNFLQLHPAQALVKNNLERHEKIIACSGEKFALIYTYTGRPFEINPHDVTYKNAYWYNPRDGKKHKVNNFQSIQVTFDPPGETRVGNDWVLILDS